VVGLKDEPANLLAGGDHTVVLKRDGKAARVAQVGDHGARLAGYLFQCLGAVKVLTSGRKPYTWGLVLVGHGDGPLSM
jgi:hypothetical protein